MRLAGPRTLKSAILALNSHNLPLSILINIIYQLRIGLNVLRVSPDES